MTGLAWSMHRLLHMIQWIDKSLWKSLESFWFIDEVRKWNISGITRYEIFIEVVYQTLIIEVARKLYELKNTHWFVMNSDFLIILGCIGALIRDFSVPLIAEDSDEYRDIFYRVIEESSFVRWDFPRQRIVYQEMLVNQWELYFDHGILILSEERISNLLRILFDNTYRLKIEFNIRLIRVQAGL